MGSTFGEEGIYKPNKRLENARALEGTVVLEISKLDLTTFQN
jgi:CRP-like cAMP-binding protein